MRDQVVLRYLDGRTLKGYAEGFSERAESVNVSLHETGKREEVPFAQLKAVFFVKSFEGERSYREKKRYGISEKKGDRVFVKFTDGELLVGYLDGEVPWDRKKGYYLSKTDSDLKGFYMIPTDIESNNNRVFILLHNVADVTVMT